MKYRKKPVVIEAEQFFRDKTPWPLGVVVTAVNPDDPSFGNHTVVCTLEGNMHVSDGDWIITGIKGERYPVKPDIFEATYEPAEGGTQ